MFNIIIIISIITVFPNFLIKSEDLKKDISKELNKVLIKEKKKSNIWSAEAFTAYRKDKIDVINSSIDDSNVLSRWGRVHVIASGLNSKIKLSNRLSILNTFSYGKVFRGVFNTKYDVNNSYSNDSFHSIGDIKGNVIDLDIALSYDFNINDNISSLRLNTGYSYFSQDYNVVDTIPISSNLYYSPSNYYYKSDWYAPWIGFDSDYKIYNNLMFNLFTKIHYFEHEVKTLLRSNYFDLENKSTGIGYSIEGSLLYEVNDNLDLNFGVNYINFITDKKNNIKNFTLEDKWKSFSFKFGLKAKF